MSGVTRSSIGAARRKRRRAAGPARDLRSHRRCRLRHDDNRRERRRRRRRLCLRGRQARLDPSV
eukprot:6212566-Pleurochrysis_carterae.AAC.1